jgi:hypothetical protein
MQSALGGAPASKSRVSRAAAKAAKAVPKAAAASPDESPAPARA